MSSKRFDAQQKEIQTLSTVVLEAQKTMQTNAETLHSLLTGMENMGENMRSMQEDMMSWQQDYHNEEEQFQDLRDQLLQEVPLADPKKGQNEGNIPPVVSKPLTTLPKMPTIEEEPVVQSATQSKVPEIVENQGTDEQRFERLIGRSMDMPVIGKGGNGPAEGQLKNSADF